ncbi:hypothetical protein Tco_0408343 [Tanacetum coccineum]
MLTSILTLLLSLLRSSQSKVPSSSLSLVPIIPSSIPVLIIRPPFVSIIFLLLEKSILDTIGGQAVGHTHGTLDCRSFLRGLERVGLADSGMRC